MGDGALCQNGLLQFHIETFCINLSLNLCLHPQIYDNTFCAINFHICICTCVSTIKCKLLFGKPRVASHRILLLPLHIDHLIAICCLSLYSLCCMQARDHNYVVTIEEPPTSWKYDVAKLVQ